MKNIILKLSVISLIGVLLYYLFRLNIANYLFILFIVSSLVFSFDSKISFSIAFILLFYVIFYTVLGDEKKAEIISVYTYYFLLLGFISEVVYIFFKMDDNDLLRKNNKEKILLSSNNKKGII
ncbi:MAG: hypothetical protein PHH06_02025 [Candidatus Gracilibacteria bacterium]|nr:hypothetical protein [Candidatus Gracilibacteria bacterium]